MQTTTDRVKCVFATIVRQSDGNCGVAIKFANESDKQAAMDGTPVIIKEAWKS